MTDMITGCFASKDYKSELFINQHAPMCVSPERLQQCFSTFVRPRPGKFFFL